MTEEIKEVLEDLRNKDNYIEDYGYDYKIISIRDVSILLDYITNLQEENETFKAKLDIGKTCGFCPYYKYKQRIDKTINAIEILQEIIYQQPTDNGADDFYLLDKLDGFKNILQGSDENE